jgi:hypothetical protein
MREPTRAEVLAVVREASVHAAKLPARARAGHSGCAAFAMWRAISERLAATVERCQVSANRLREAAAQEPHAGAVCASGIGHQVEDEDRPERNSERSCAPTRLALSSDGRHGVAVTVGVGAAGVASGDSAGVG